MTKKCFKHIYIRGENNCLYCGDVMKTKIKKLCLYCHKKISKNNSFFCSLYCKYKHRIKQNVLTGY
jgi:hypothetical protein